MKRKPQRKRATVGALVRMADSLQTAAEHNSVLEKEVKSQKLVIEHRDASIEQFRKQVDRHYAAEQASTKRAEAAEATYADYKRVVNQFLSVQIIGHGLTLATATPASPAGNTPVNLRS
jgi:hypothetical protein